MNMLRLCIGFTPILLTALPTQVAIGQANSSAVYGTVSDPDAAVIPGAAICLESNFGRSLNLISQGDGTFRFSAVEAGIYSLTITMAGFGTFVRQGIQVAPSHDVMLNVRMTIQEAVQQIAVSDQSAFVNVDQDANASATIIKGRDLDSLSDDPDELSAELSALAGPPDGPSGADFYVDGFTGGQLPSKSSIREIRVNQAPYSAQYDRLGVGRVEVFTKPGSDRLHGSFQVNGNHSVLNTGDPLLNAFLTPGQSPQTQPAYYSLLTLGSVTGAISRWASFSFSGSEREIRQNTLVSATVPNGITACPGQEDSCNYSLANPAPQSRIDFSPRFDLQLGKNNTLMIRGGYERNQLSGDGVGGLNLPSTGYELDTSESTLQTSLTQILNTYTVNEIRAEFQRDTTDQIATSTSPALTVSGAFIGGGALSGSSTDHQVHLEFQDYLALDLDHHFLRFGGRLRATHDANSTTAGTNGAFTYDCLANVVTTVNPDGTPTTQPCSADAEGVVSSFENGQASQFSRTLRNLPITATVADLGLYAEDEWKIGPKLEISYGLRYETQNYVSDHHDFAPRLSLAYGLGKGKSPKTILRGGVGVFYQRFPIANVVNTVRQNGINQVQTVITNPNGACTPSDMAACNGEMAGNTTYSSAPGLRSPYSIIFGIGVDREIVPGVTISFNANHNRAIHQLYSENINAPHNGVYPVPGLEGGAPPVLYRYESGAVYSQSWLILNVNARAGKWLSLYGYTYLNFVKSDTNGASTFPSVPGAIRLDYGRAAWDIRNKNLLGGSSSMPLGLTWSFTLVGWTGTPYNVTLGSDLNKDSVYNERPAFLPGRSEANCKNSADFARPVAGIDYTPIPINYCTGSGAFVAYTRLVKAFGIGPITAAKSSGRGLDTGRRYNLSFGVQIQNIFNNADFAAPQGVLSSPQFGRSTQLAGQPFTSNNAVRHINLQSSFSF